eukprot:scaffold49997_cov59-Phaeocystis_antarctica.AAC.2
MCGKGRQQLRAPANSPSATNRSGCSIFGAAGTQSSGLANFAALPLCHVAVCGRTSPPVTCQSLFRPLRDSYAVSLASVLGSVTALSELASRKCAPVRRMCAPGGSCPILDNIGSCVSTPSPEEAATILAICCWHRCMKASSGMAPPLGPSSPLPALSPTSPLSPTSLLLAPLSLLLLALELSGGGEAGSGSASTHGGSNAVRTRAARASAARACASASPARRFAAATASRSFSFS